MIEFRSKHKAIEHLIAHVLTPDESHAWHFVWYEKHWVLADTQEALDQCYRLRRELAEALPQCESEDLPEVAKSLMDSYLASIANHDEESRECGWTSQKDGRRVGLDTNGIYAVVRINGHESSEVITAFLPGFGTQSGTTAAQQHPDDPHARVCKSQMRGDHRSSTSQKNESTRQRLQHRFRDQWSPEQKVYYLVFREVMKFIRAYQPGPGGGHGIGLDDLKKRLPRMSKLSFERWQGLRRVKEVSRG